MKSSNLNDFGCIFIGSATAHIPFIGETWSGVQIVSAVTLLGIGIALICWSKAAARTI